MGGGGQSSCGSHLDFVSYWADKTVEEAVLQGQQLRLQKTQPLPSREYDVNIDFIKPPRIAKSSGRRRNKSSRVSTNRHRSRSPSMGVSPFTNTPKRQKRQKFKPTACGLRIAELAVPTKRHCLETWKNMYKTLPDYMIERLRQHVMDQRPIVQISDAINCFKRKCKKQKKTEKSKAVESRNKMIKNPLRKNEVKVLAAIFGHRIAKKLIVPLNLILNSDLEKVADVISYDIGTLMRKSKNIDSKNKIYKLVETDIVKKVTVWVTGILEETSNKILEDQLRDFEEEMGPALDCVDELVDNVLDICIPVPETFDESSISESYKSGLGEEILESQISSEKVDFKEEYIYENIENHLKNEIVTLINNIGKEPDQKSEDVFHENTEDHFINEVVTLINTIGKEPDQKSEDIFYENTKDHFKNEIVTLVNTIGKEPDQKSEDGFYENTEDHFKNEIVTLINTIGKEPDQKSKDVLYENTKDHFKNEIVTLINNIGKEPDQKSEDVFYENTEDHFKNEIVTLINNIGKEAIQKSEEFLDVEKGTDWQSIGDVEPSDSDEKNEDYAEAEESIALEQAGDEEKIALEQTESKESFAFEQAENEEVKDIDIKDREHLQSGNDAAEPNENAETEDTDINYENPEVESDIAEANADNFENKDDADLLLSESVDEKNDDKDDEYLEPEDIAQPTEVLEIHFENTDDVFETFTDPAEENEAEDYPPLPEEIDRKVTFGGSAEQKADINLNWKASIDHIEFAEPNEGLLSDADESWPNNVHTPLLRPSQSVSKSITSLGRIKEDDEKSNLKLEDEENKYKESEEKAAETLRLEIADQTKHTDSGEQDENQSKIYGSIKSKDETASKNSGRKDKRAKNKIIPDSSMIKPISKISTPTASQRSSSKSNKIEMSPSPTKPIPKILKKKMKSKDTEFTKTSQSAKVIDGDVKTKDGIKFSSRLKSKPDYRVNMKTAPVWINRNFGEPSCSCVHIPSKAKVKPKVNENLIRRWCQDLEQGYENLKMWNEWVENTTKTVSLLQREIGKSYSPERCSNKEWIQLKKNIDRDALLWAKLNKHTQERLKCYRKMYQKRSDTPTKYFICRSQKK